MCRQINSPCFSLHCALSLTYIVTTYVVCCVLLVYEICLLCCLRATEDKMRFDLLQLHLPSTANNRNRNRSKVFQRNAADSALVVQCVCGMHRKKPPLDAKCKRWRSRPLMHCQLHACFQQIKMPQSKQAKRTRIWLNSFLTKMLYFH